MDQIPEETNPSNLKHNNRIEEAGHNSLGITIAAYFFYALFMLIECLDFSALLHSPEPGFHATYDINNVIFYVLDLIICVSFGLVLLIIYFAADKKPYTVIFTVITVTLLRAGLIYYLYMFKEGSYQIAPFIYKKANEMSDIVRTVVLPVQVLAGLICAWRWRLNIAKKQPHTD
ncbi:MAG: hypothetical protein EOP42_23560 [Sphingobacteriaceae bacterium]|nr:MAG: hypothetical protein EOP42_23560 [Sphingobacteriaceae bacterium]